MILFFDNRENIIFAVQTQKQLSNSDINKLSWLFGNSSLVDSDVIKSTYLGSRAVMVSPWSTNAVEMTQNMGINHINRIEKYVKIDQYFEGYDPMLFEKFTELNQSIFIINIDPEPINHIENIESYNESEGLSLSKEEVNYLLNVSNEIGRKLTDSEIFGFSQVNSEHCRHKIFNGKFIIDGKEMPNSLFKMIKETSKVNSNKIVSAYKDNVAFIKGPVVNQFSPTRSDIADYYKLKSFESVISLKAETHNFPTTVEPFNGAATGSGGEIRDRLAGGKGSIPMAGTAVYMTPYSRFNKYSWEKKIIKRDWLYQNPIDILIKASNGASDFGNKFGQPLICGSILTFENQENNDIQGYDKVIMLAGGIGYAKATDAIKENPKLGDRIIVMGGENYRIGMGGAAVSSADTGEFSSGIELNAIQRSNPEMQKRVANAIRGVIESEDNFIISIHDHGAGGHLNCLTELVENSGGIINIDKLPIGDSTLSFKEIVGNESQERMGLLVNEKKLEVLNRICERERAPIYDVGHVTDNGKFTIKSDKISTKAVDLKLKHFFGSSPTTIIEDVSFQKSYSELNYNSNDFYIHLKELFKLEAVGCKDWLTNKVDRCVGGKVAKQQCVGQLQLPLNNCGVIALDYNGNNGIATSIGHSPISGLIDPIAGSRNSVTEALTNIIWAPLKDNIAGISLSANWMWPCKNKGEDSRLYEAVLAISEFAIELGINIPTGKDSLSMTQKYNDREVSAPGTVIISAVAHCDDITRVIEPVFNSRFGNIYYINLSCDDYKLGGSSFAQILGEIGEKTPTIKDSNFIVNVFNTIQDLIRKDLIIAGHDIGSGGLITTIMEMCFADNNIAANIDLTSIGERDSIKLLFSENSGIVVQSKDESIEEILDNKRIDYCKIGSVTTEKKLLLKNHSDSYEIDIEKYRDYWYKTSMLLDKKQTANNLSEIRYINYKKQPLNFKFPTGFSGKKPVPLEIEYRPKAAVIREKGSNSERELANALFLAGFQVKDIHMTDLITGRENLEDVQFIGTVGGFSNSDVLGSAKGWAGAFLYNKKAKESINNFISRKDTLSIGVCNGCQLFMELEVVNPDHEIHGKMTFNDSNKHESGFTSVNIQKNNSIMMSSLENCNLGVWISHGEGKFNLPYSEDKYNIIAKYTYESYPSNPNGSDFNIAMMSSSDGRHLVTMPHIERSIFQWNWAYYIRERNDKVSPWIQAFINARDWIISYNSKK
ncbi:MAG: phosphoribosylformylglycinamidine synthase [Flavobacteriaceae bacterium]|nr:phosphoribosylformylglycinamidine synthase [Flavobacteriaceae bacterium]